MTESVDPDRLEAGYQKALATLLDERHPDGYWVGELSTSALSTATAVSAVSLVLRHQTPDPRLQALIDNGVRWLLEHQNADGGWGDTDRSFSNISTTMLCRAALRLTSSGTQSRDREGAGRRALSYLDKKCGSGPKNHAEAIRNRYGKDRTFSVPILMNAALAGLVDWSEVPALPFELACLPQSWFRFLRLPVVSYALPALIAIGQAIYHHRPPWNPITRFVRRLSRERSLRVLQRIQPSSGGFLEAIPLTSFVVMSLASIGRADHPVAKKGVEFLVNSVRPDGSWPIDSNLSVWVTTLAVNALAAGGELQALNPLDGLGDWLLKQQFKERHPYTGADPGGWGWTHLPGNVPDADDTAGAMLAALNAGDNELALLKEAFDQGAIAATNIAQYPILHAPASAMFWLLWLQNHDGGWPTFCRGWGKLPFDRSGPDLTGHALRALSKWALFLKGHIPQGMKNFPYGNAIPNGIAYLARSQRPDGSWLPLWFGNQHAPDEANPVYGTARVLAAYRDLGMMDTEPARRGVAYLLSVQNPDGGWGGAARCPSSVEETSLAVEALIDAPSDSRSQASLGNAIREAPLRASQREAELPGVRSQTEFGNEEQAVQRGLNWLIHAIEQGRLKTPEPIGFYFAKLWYYEKLYPIIFAVAALGRARRRLNPPPDGDSAA